MGALGFIGQTTFNIQRPYVTVYCQISSSFSIANKDGKQYLWFGNNITHIHGIDLNGAYYGAINGNFCWVQVINIGSISIRPGEGENSILNARDGGFPYELGLSMNDSPHIELPSTALTVYQSLEASAFLLFKPQGNDTAWVPLAKVDWSCEGFAKKINNVWTIDNTTYPPSYTLTDNATAHPTWERVAEEAQ